MKAKQLVRAWFVVVIASTMACLGDPPTQEDLESDLDTSEHAALAKGRICAAGEGGPATCIASGGDVRSVYSAVTDNCGTDPGQGSCWKRYLWPEFPEGMKFSDGIRSQAALKQLLRDTDAILTFARTLGVSDYERILSGKLSDTLRKVREAQAKALAKPAWSANEPVQVFAKAVQAKAAKIIDPVAMEQATLKQKVPEVQAILSWAQRRLAAPTQDYTALVQRFRAYQANAAKVAADLNGFSARASQSDLPALAALTNDIAAYADLAGSEADQLTLDATRLRATLVQLDDDYGARIDAHRALVEERLGAVPDLSSSAQRSLANMAAYSQRRRAQTDAAVGELMRGIRTRKAALIDQQVDAETQQVLRDAAFLRASGEFLAQATDWRAKIGKLPPRTTTHRFYLWTETYDRYLELLTLEPLCSSVGDEARPSWRDAGCIAFERSFGIAHTYLDTTIPQAIRLTISQLRSKGVPETTLTTIEALLNEEKLRQAVLAYDAAALSTEGT